MPFWAKLTIGAAIVAVAGLVVLYLEWIERRGRLRELRLREIPPIEQWRKTHYPQATKEEIVVIRRALETLAAVARVEPTQLRPDDRLVGFVLQPHAVSTLDPENDWGDLLYEFDQILAEYDATDLAEWEILANESWETVGDAINFLSKRTCPRKTSVDGRRSVG